MVRKDFTSISITKEDRDLFVKLNSDFNVLNPASRKTREEFFGMMLRRLKGKLKKEHTSKEKSQ